MRYRFYNAWGLSSADIALTVGFNGVTFWLGVIAVAGVAFLFEPAASPALFGVRIASLYPLGVLLLLAVGAYLFAAAFVRAPLRLRDWEFSLPSPGLALAQLAVSCVDWVLAGAVLYALLPPHTPGLTFILFLGPFLLAQIVGLLSHVPAGIGVFDALFVTLMSAYLPPASLVGVLIAYRAIYYLLPLAVALAMLGVHANPRVEDLDARVGVARAGLPVRARARHDGGRRGRGCPGREKPSSTQFHGGLIRA